MPPALITLAGKVIGPHTPTKSILRMIGYIEIYSIMINGIFLDGIFCQIKPTQPLREAKHLRTRQSVSNLFRRDHDDECAASPLARSANPLPSSFLDPVPDFEVRPHEMFFG